MATFGDLRNRILRLLGNVEAEGMPAGIDIDAVSAAFDAVLPWAPKLKKVTITGDGTSSAFNLPVDFYEVDAVVIQATGETLPKAIFSPNSPWGINLSITNNWMVFPTGQISFGKIPTANEIIDLYYSAYWPKPLEEGDVLEPPDYLMYAISLYAVAYILQPNSLGVSSISAYKTRVDSGNPEHNPVEKSITFLLNLFNVEMNRHPRHQRSQT